MYVKQEAALGNAKVPLIQELMIPGLEVFYFKIFIENNNKIQINDKYTLSLVRSNEQAVCQSEK